MAALFFTGSRSKLSQWVAMILLSCVTLNVAYDRVLYVTPRNGLCPKDISPCRTLDGYIKLFSSSFIRSNTSVVFLNGTHHLNSVIEVRDSKDVRISRFKSLSSLDSNHDRRPDAIIRCISNTSCGFVFKHSSQISIKDVSFDSCGVKVDLRPCPSAALSFQSGNSISLMNIIVNNSNGFGLCIENTAGLISINRSWFLRTTCRTASYRPRQVCGNARLWYGSTGDDSCQKAKPLEMTFFRVHKSRFVGGREGVTGLEITLGCPNVSVHIEKTTISRNKRGNLILDVTDSSSKLNGSIVTIVGSTISHGSANKGGGVRVLSRTHQSNGSVCVGGDSHNVLEVNNTNFSSNTAQKFTGSAVYITHYQGGISDCVVQKVKFVNCTFVDNFGNGTTVEIDKHLILADYTSPPLKVIIEGCEFHNNSNHNMGPILDFIMCHVNLSNSVLSNSQGTAISLQNSFLNLYGENCFENNEAVYGGALKICEGSVVYFHNHSHTHFVNNTARVGGAVFIERECIDTLLPCVLQPGLRNNISVDDFTQFLSVDFVNNVAAVAGNALYGGALDLCYTVANYFYDGQPSIYNFIHIINVTFNISDPSPSWISSNPRGVCFCDKNATTVPRYSCQTERSAVQVYPGETFTVSAVTVGQLNGTTWGAIQSSLHDPGDNHQLVVLSGGKASNTCTSLNYTVLSNRSYATVSLSTSSESVESYSYKTAFNVHFSIELLQCPLEFELQKSEVGYECMCNQLFNYTPKYKTISYPRIGCDIDTKTIWTKTPLWFARDHNSSSTFDKLVVSWNCDYYCKDYYHNVSITSPDEQCLSGHTGVLCGACEPGLSRLSGSNECSNCSNIGLLKFIPLELFSGVFLVFLLTILNITVTEGTINGLLIYATVLFGSYSYFEQIKSAVVRKFLWTFISWVNLNSGFFYCLFDGMTAYQQIWMQFGHTFYVLFIQLVMVLLSRRFTFFTRLFGKNVLKVLATLLFLNQSRLEYACFTTMQFAYIYTHTNTGSVEHRLVWCYDGNVLYGGFKHSLLLIVAIVCSIIALWFNLSLLCIQCLQRGNSYWCLRWVNKLRPLFEAYTGPCNDHYRFWPGLVFVLRVLLSAVNMYFSRYNTLFLQSKLVLTAMLCVLFLLLGCVFPRGVYKKWPLNVLEFSFMLNLCILSIYLIFAGPNSGANAVATSTSVAFITFVGILLYHIHLRIRGTRAWKCIATCHSRCAEKLFKRKTSHRNDENDFLLPQPLPAVARYDECREPLLDQ